MELWILVTIAAAFLQNLRSMVQKHLKARLSSMGATAIRFFFAAPLAWALWLWVSYNSSLEILSFTKAFYAYVGLAALSQISGTLLLVYLFGLKNFAVGSTLARTEAVQAALIGFVLLGDTVSLWAAIGLFVSLIGVLMIAGKIRLSGSILDRAAWIGLASGASFAVSSVLYRAASQSLDIGGPFIHGAAVLVVATSIQSVLLFGWLAWRERPQLTAIVENWRAGILVGLTGGLASLGWFTAFTLQNAAYVKAVAQIELLFSLLASWLFFREKIRRIEVAGIALVALGILMLRL